MSSDAQDLSPQFQSQAITVYAETHSLVVVETYLDAGKSGLTLQRRPAMKQLLADVAGERRLFSVILVYDISRWGRFQDTDASAYYEYHCRLHGVEVLYVQEPFSGSDSPLATLFKSFKRAMAAEYSRELATKTRAGQTAALERGFHMGTLPCIGIGRVAVAKNSGALRHLAPGEHKAMNREHVRWIRGPDEEVRLVQRIFELYASTDLSVKQVASHLTAQGEKGPNGRPLTRCMVSDLLACEAFVGHFVWGRRKGERQRSTDDPNIRRASSIEPIVSNALWEAVRSKLAARAGVERSREQLLADLRRAVSQQPSLNARQLQIYGCASRSTYVKHFGSFASALEVIGMAPARKSAAERAAISEVREAGWRICNDVESVLRHQGVRCERPGAAHRAQMLIIEGKVRLRVQVICRRPSHRGMRWWMERICREPFDHILVVRTNADHSVFDSILLAYDDYLRHPRSFGDEHPDGFLFLTKESEVARHMFALCARARPMSASLPMQSG